MRIQFERCITELKVQPIDLHGWISRIGQPPVTRSFFWDLPRLQLNKCIVKIDSWNDESESRALSGTF